MNFRLYAEVLEGLFGTAPVGAGPSALDAAEVRLGCALPKTLRQFYGGVGGEDRSANSMGVASCSAPRWMNPVSTCFASKPGFEPQ
ncbi:MAG: hypothetical protein H6716_03160 [Polyangiaceae bacterium]|nr:hypothetical protein [Polyangiaceae bacterium]